ncbi:Isochorismatase hydrolase [Pleomassaria siparia CBS 279.74]|uniref:Isochorismatase hydrolase n=1 Tax=Pleomassaria siparia CBS 279.74 TaxID=1314801 RepID=A0A6G1KQS3_9PLEO|nr:Isochorismatase hydrolase [Pleomassaria siparia CBS 279.74]
MPDSKTLEGTLGPDSNKWTYQTSAGFTLGPSSPPNLTIQTTTTPIRISPAATALVIIDMQNFFLSPFLGRQLGGAGHLASDQLLKHAIPAARKAGIRIVWLNWGLNEQDLKDMPAGVSRAFGFAGTEEDGPEHSGLGSPCGQVEVIDVDGSTKKIDAGRLLMRDTWNAAIFPPLDTEYMRGSKLEKRPDVWIHKNRMSGLWGALTECEEFLEKEGIRTLLFSGVNTDQCVGGSLMDAFSKGYDCVLLSDGCGTTSPDFAQKAWEYNVANTFGFCTTCVEFAKGVEVMKT